MTLKKISLLILSIGIISCNSTKKDSSTGENYNDVKVVGAMKDVMWKGELESSIDLDTISNRKGLYGLGPQSFLTGELLINDGQSYVSKVTSDSTMIVEKNFGVSAPFFVYANVDEWEEIKLPANIRTMNDLENFIEENTTEYERPFAFKLNGKVANTIIHILDLPEGNKVSSPEEAHQGQINYKLKNENAEIVGFFSTEHKGIFTHHDSFLHMHLITENESKMGHIDELEIDKMKLYIPKN